MSTVQPPPSFACLQPTTSSTRAPGKTFPRPQFSHRSLDSLKSNNERTSATILHSTQLFYRAAVSYMPPIMSRFRPRHVRLNSPATDLIPTVCIFNHHVTDRSDNRGSTSLTTIFRSPFFSFPIAQALSGGLLRVGVGVGGTCQVGFYQALGP